MNASRRMHLVTAYCWVLSVVSCGNAAEPSPVAKIEAHEGWISALAMHAERACVFSGGDDRTLIRWDLATGEKRWSRRLPGAVTALAVLSKRNQLAVGTWDGQLFLYDAGDGQRLRTLGGHRETITSIAVSPDESRLVSGSGDDTLKVWDALTGKLRFQVPQGSEYDVTAVAFGKDGRWIAYGDGENGLGILDADSGDLLMTLQGHDEAVSCVAWATGVNRIISGSWDNTVRLWDDRTGAELQVIRQHESDVTSLHCTADGSVVVSGSEDRTAKVWGGLDAELKATIQHPTRVTCVALSRDATLVAVAGKQLIKVWRLAE